MTNLFDQLSSVDTRGSVEKQQMVSDIKNLMEQGGYTIVDQDDQRPWGAYLKFANNQADSFITDFFKGISPAEARLGNKDAELSPKILIVSPNQRLSWQYHERRAERWVFLTDGKFEKSYNDDEHGAQSIEAGGSVQFTALERHRLIGRANEYSLVAEIWQHTDSNSLSDENDIVRLQDDYNR